MAINDPMLDPDFKFSINTFPGNGVKVTWDLSFSGGYIRREHVKAYTESATGVVTERTLVWVGPSQVTVTPAVPTGTNLIIYRDTPKAEPLVDFTDGAIINEPNLDLLAKQAVFVAAEMVDRFADIAERGDAASSLAIAASAGATEALAQASAALAASAAAGILATDTAVQFQALLETVQDLSGADLSGLARINLPQTYTAQQTFPSIRLSDADEDLEFYPNLTYRYRLNGGAWQNKALGSWDSLTGVPLTFPPTAHTHTWESITGKPTTFAPTAHTHTWDSITGKPTEFTPVSHTHSWSAITDKPAVAVLNQPADFSTLAVAGNRVVAITAGPSDPVGGQDGDIHFVTP